MLLKVGEKKNSHFFFLKCKHSNLNTHTHTHTHTHNGILLSDKNVIFCHSKTWMNLEGIMLSEISQTEKTKYSMLSLACGI